MTGAARIGCCVPFCRRTIGAAKLAPNSEWVCGKHWPLVPKRLKRHKRLIAKLIHREMHKHPLFNEYWKMPPGSRARIRAYHLWTIDAAVWERCKRAAIEAAGGIG